MTDMPEVAMDVKRLCEDMMDRSRDLNCGFRDASFLERAATALSTLSRELAEARAMVSASEVERYRSCGELLLRAEAAEAASASKDERIAALERALDDISRRYSNGATADTLAMIARQARARSTKEPT